MKQDAVYKEKRRDMLKVVDCAMMKGVREKKTGYIMCRKNPLFH
jgi:hypothetical protein